MRHVLTVIFVIMVILLMLTFCSPITITSSTPTVDNTVSINSFSAKVEITPTPEPENIIVIDAKEIEVRNLLSDIGYIEPSSIPEAEEKIAECEEYIQAMIVGISDKYGTDEYPKYFAIIEPSLTNTVEVYRQYLDDIEEMTIASELLELWAQRSAEYPEATQVWKYLKDEIGLSDICCAGIMGNLMCETGDQNLNIHPYTYDSSGAYYGICQWSARFYSEIHGADLQTQLEFLKNTIENEIDTFGYAYGGNFYYDDFKELTTPEAAAEAFARCYERCAPSTIYYRQMCAVEAYEYFTS